MKLAMTAPDSHLEPAVGFEQSDESFGTFTRHSLSRRLQARRNVQGNRRADEMHAEDQGVRPNDVAFFQPMLRGVGRLATYPAQWLIVDGHACALTCKVTGAPTRW